MTLFRLDASIRTQGSVSREIADLVEEGWRNGHPDEQIVRRHLGTDPLPATAWPLAVSAAWTPEEQKTDEMRAAPAPPAPLVDELVEADALLFAVPLYNFGVSQHFKTYADLVITDPRMGPGGTRPLAGRPAVLVTVRGGTGPPREGWDPATGWMRRILADVWGLDLRVVEREFTLVGVNPALDEFTDLATHLHQEAPATAEEAGGALVAKVTLPQAS